MENRVENINIEKNKELFEYEMTEVILRLKGEFAAFSGKNTRFAEMMVDDSKFRICTSGVVQAKMEDCNVQPPVIRSIQQTKPVLVEMKGTALKLPALTQISDENTKKEKDSLVKRRVNVWHGIVLPALPAISKDTIANSFSEKPMQKEEKENISFVEIPRLVFDGKSIQCMKEKAHIKHISVRVPKTIMNCGSRNMNALFVSSVPSRNKKSIPESRFNSKAMDEQIKKLSESHNIKITDVRVPHVVKNVTIGITKSESIAVNMVEVPEIDINGSNVKVIPTINQEAVMIDVPTVPVLGLIELKKTETAINVRPVELQKVHGFDFEIKKPTVMKNEVTVLELRDIKLSGINNVCIACQPILVPNTSKCNVKRKNVDLSGVRLSVLLPDTGIQKPPIISGVSTNSSSFEKTPEITTVSMKAISKVQRTDIDISVPQKVMKVSNNIQGIFGQVNVMAVNIPAISSMKLKSIVIKDVSKPDISIPSTMQSRFTMFVPDRHKHKVERIEFPHIKHLKANGNLSKVNIIHHGAIAIPQRPKIEDTVDNIIALAVAKR